jgi:hypothetical protein
LTRGGQATLPGVNHHRYHQPRRGILILIVARWRQSTSASSTSPRHSHPDCRAALNACAKRVTLQALPGDRSVLDASDIPQCSSSSSATA